MLNKLQDWLMNVAAKWIWFAIMLPIRITLGLCFAIAKYMPSTVQLPYKVVKREEAKDKQWWS
jgi:hypothetical protein